MPLSGLDAHGVARSLSQLTSRSEDHADAYLEVVEVTECRDGGPPPRVRVRREQGLAVRLVRGRRTWLAAADRIDARAFSEALRRVARVSPAAPYPSPELPSPRFGAPPDLGPLRRFPGAVRRSVRELHAAFPMEILVGRHRRVRRVVGTRLAPEAEESVFHSCSIRLPWGGYGALLPGLEGPVVARLAASLVSVFRGRHASPPSEGERPMVLGPDAAAVLLHEAVAHALESDTLALGGDPAAARGVRLGAPQVNVLDDPSGAPATVRLETDDEGTPVLRRWLLREGVVEQPMADLFTAGNSAKLVPGCGRRSDRRFQPVPRSYHLELLPGECSFEELLTAASGGLYLPEVSRGALDPLTGRLTLEFPYAREIRKGAAGRLSGPCLLRTSVREVLQGIVAVAREVREAGAGWCAKGGVRLPVWASAPALQLLGPRVER